ncbi:MAG: hypothetical protein Q8S27_20825, partial [Hoeflea sp.]|nr:hypothetical protein [Hoeflea sp.]
MTRRNPSYIRRFKSQNDIASNSRHLPMMRHFCADARRQLVYALIRLEEDKFARTSISIRPRISTRHGHGHPACLPQGRIFAVQNARQLPGRVTICPCPFTKSMMIRPFRGVEMASVLKSNPASAAVLALCLAAAPLSLATQAAAQQAG